MADLSLTLPQRRRLLDALKAVPQFSSREGRDLLLRDLPAALVDTIPRHASTTLDLDAIVEGVRAWGPLADGTPALLAVLDNARYYADEQSAAGQALAALYQELSAPTPANAPRKRPPRLTLTQKAERYQEVKVALEEHRWDLALDLVKRIRGYRDVKDLVWEARRGWASQQQRLGDLSDAYIARDWAGVLRTARQLDPDEPPEVAGWVARAWREVPVEERVLPGHTNGVLAVAVTPDGRQILSGSWDQTLRLWDLASGETVRTFAGHTDTVWAVAVTPDAGKVLSGSKDRTLRLWDIASGQAIRSFEGHTDSVEAVVVTPDGRHALSGSYDRTLRLWDLDSGQTVHILAGPTAPVWAVAVTPDGRHALSGSEDRTLRLWDLASEQILRTLKGHRASVGAVAVTPDAGKVLCGANDGTLWLWDLAAGQTVRMLAGHSKGGRALALTPEGRHAFSGANDGRLRLWDLAAGQELRTLPGHDGHVLGVAVSPDGRTVVSGGGDGMVRVWTFPEGVLG